jgi:hypothetical protein
MPLGTVAGAKSLSVTHPAHPAAARPHVAVAMTFAQRRARAEARHHHALAIATLHGLERVATSLRVSVSELRARWERVAICEVGGNWSMVGSQYSGIGFLNSTWYAYGGRTFASRAGQATVDQQILVGMRVTHGWIPDQGGCNPGGW